MSSIDNLFRRPNVPPKRKLEDPTATFSSRPKSQPNKAAKLNNGDSPNTTSTSIPKPNGKSASVEDEPTNPAEDQEEEEEDIEAGPELPPEDEADEDDEGRFFGSGVSKQELEVLEYIDKNEDTEVQTKIDSAWLRKTAINFERKINKNAELRAKYEDDPLKFIGSEADLDTEIKGLSVLSEHGELYVEFAKLGCVGSLVQLLAHENTDIAIAVCELLAELTDEDATVDEEQWTVLAKAMVKADVVDLLVSNLGRLDEVNENDRAGVYHVLSVIENLLSGSGNLGNVGANAKLIAWLKNRITTPDTDARARVGQNRQYAAEILAILLQQSEKSRTRFLKEDGVDVLLQLLSSYRKKDPEKDSDEEEFVENLFDCLASMVRDSAGVDKFLDGEGVELCLIMMREGKLAKARAIRILDHACGSREGGRVGERIVEAAGLKTIFSTFMKDKKQEQDIIEHLIGISASLLRYLPADSAARIRTLAKFVEKDYEKAVRLVELRQRQVSRIAAVDKEIAQERQGLSADDIEALEGEWLSRRFDAGLFALQTIDVILTWLVAEDAGARKKISELLSTVGASLEVLKTSLRDQVERLDPEEGRDTKEMLESLIQCL